MLLENRNAIIYGAGGSIGAAAARTFAREGARLFLVGRTRTSLDAVAADVAAAGGSADVAVLQGSGVILHLNSGSARGAQPGMGSTGPADAATETLMRYLAAEVGPHGVRVLGIWIAGVPETLTPEKLAAVNPNLRLDAAAVQGLIGHLDQARMTRRSPRLDEVVATVAFLASDQAGGITGTMVNVTAGLIPTLFPAFGLPPTL
jgi:NAD(P)-dependent dehydrogenase (short-subunit alcohol dehydrogenase family)